MVVEPGGAVSLAAVLSGKIETVGKTTAIVISGGNVDMEQFAAIQQSAD
jgi:threonine dehydratase